MGLQRGRGFSKPRGVVFGPPKEGGGAAVKEEKAFDKQLATFQVRRGARHQQGREPRCYGKPLEWAPFANNKDIVRIWDLATRGPLCKQLLDTSGGLADKAS